MKKFSSNQQKGFTLVEMLVASLIFSIIVLAVSEIFVTVLTNQRRAFAAQQIEESGQFAMELMAREIRVSDITDQDSTDCSATTLTIDHPVNGTVVYSLNSGVLQRTADGVTTDISSSEVKFSRLNFCVAGSGPTDQEQARVAILAAVQNKSGRDTLTFNLETTVTSRNVTSELQQ